MEWLHGRRVKGSRQGIESAAAHPSRLPSPLLPKLLASVPCAEKLKGFLPAAGRRAFPALRRCESQHAGVRKLHGQRYPHQGRNAPLVLAPQVQRKDQAGYHNIALPRRSRLCNYEVCHVDKSIKAVRVAGCRAVGPPLAQLLPTAPLFSDSVLPLSCSLLAQTCTPQHPAYTASVQLNTQGQWQLN